MFHNTVQAHRTNSQSPMIHAIRKANRRERRNRQTMTFLAEIVCPVAVLYAAFAFLYYVMICSAA